MIFNIRGSFGAGKSYLVRELLSRHPNIPMSNPIDGKLEAYGIPLKSNLFVIGSYEGSTTVTGADYIRSMVISERLIREYYKLGHVLIEGAIMSGLYTRFLNLSRELGKGEYVWLLLDTPMEECLVRIRDRRSRSKNRNRPLDTEGFNTYWRRTHSQMNKLKEMGEETYLLNWQSPYEDLLNLFVEKGVIDVSTGSPS